MKILKTHPNSPGLQASPGFTLLEILLAVSIFAIVASSLYATFSTGMRAYEIGRKTGETMQVGRFATGLLARDLKNVFIIPETSYNIQYNRRREVLEQAQIRLNVGEIDALEYEEYLDYFNSMGLGLDLRFSGKGNDETAEISFVRYQTRFGSRPALPTSLNRVTYSLEKDVLVRSEEDIIRNPIDSAGEEQEDKDPQQEELVRGVLSFAVSYGYYFDGEWLETDNWDSDSWNHRFDETDLSSGADSIEGILPHLEAMRESRAQDNLPSYVRFRLTVQDDLRKSRPRIFERTINIVNARETHIRLPDEITVQDEDAEDGRRIVRREDYVRERKGSRKGRKRGSRYGLVAEDERDRDAVTGEFYLQ